MNADDTDRALAAGSAVRVPAQQPPTPPVTRSWWDRFLFWVFGDRPYRAE